jgi:hypothetical protein
MIKDRKFIGLVGIAIIAVLAACGGGGGGGSSVPATGGGGAVPTAAPTTSVTAAAGQGLVRFSITVPAKTGTSSTKRSAQFVDPNTQSIELTLLQNNGVAASGAAQGPFNLSSGSAGCTGTSSLVCTFSISAPIGNDVFLANTFSGLNGVGALGSGAIALSVVQNSTNTASLTLTGPVQSILVVSNNAANSDTLWNGVEPFLAITAAQWNAQTFSKARSHAQRVKPLLISTPAPILSERLFLIAQDTTGSVILNPTTYNQPITLTLALNGGPANATLTDTPPAGLGCAAGLSTSADGGTVQVCSPADVVTLSLIQNAFSPQQFIDCCDSFWLNFPSITASLPSPPSGFAPVLFPFTVEVVPTPIPTATGSFQVIGQ